MTQFRRRFQLLRYDRADLLGVLLALLLGSAFGALCASFSDAVTGLASAGAFPQPGLLRAWLRCALFPVLLSAALCLRCRLLFWLLYFAKGAAAAFTLWALLCSCGLPLLPLLSDTVFLLPFWILLGAVWVGQIGTGPQSLSLLLPALLLVLLAASLRDLIL